MRPYLRRLAAQLRDAAGQDAGFAAAMALLDGARRDGRTAYVVGNGGSEANAGHLVLHLLDAGLRARDLMADLPWLTALSNDVGYDAAAAQLLRRLARPNDVLVVISGSGGSPNILSALAEAEQKGLRRVGILGYGGGDARMLCNVAIVLQGNEYGPIEDAHSAVIHALYEGLLALSGQVPRLIGEAMGVAK